MSFSVLSKESDNLRLIEEAKSMLLAMKKNSHSAFSVSVDVESTLKQFEQLRQMKMQVKQKFLDVLTKNNFMQNLSVPQSEWSKIIAPDEELQIAKTSQRDAKLLVEEHRNEMMLLNSVVIEAWNTYEKQTGVLQEVTQTLETMLQEEKAVQDDDFQNEEVFQKEVRELQKQIQRYQSEMHEVKTFNAQLQARIIDLEENLDSINTVTDSEDEEIVNSDKLMKLQKMVREIEQLGAMKSQIVSPHSIEVEFLYKHVSSLSLEVTDSDEENLTLKVTLTFKEDNLGSLHLAGVKSNMESLNVNKLWDAQDCISIPCLMLKIKTAWFSHAPLLAEIKQLCKQFALDWIQHENILRLIVGKGGSIVCSLEIPPTYPSQGQVTLTSILGAPDTVQIEDLQPQNGSRLEHWMQYLENTFGKP